LFGPESKPNHHLVRGTYAVVMELSLRCDQRLQLLHHWLPFAGRPAFFLPGDFDAAPVGGVHRLRLETMEWTVETQVRIFWFASVGVMDPFVPGIGVSVILDHPELKQFADGISSQDLQTLGRSLLQSCSEEFYDRFTLPSRLHRYLVP